MIDSALQIRARRAFRGSAYLLFLFIMMSLIGTQALGYWWAWIPIVAGGAGASIMILGYFLPKPELMLTHSELRIYRSGQLKQVWDLGSIDRVRLRLVVFRRGPPSIRLELFMGSREFRPQKLRLDSEIWGDANLRELFLRLAKLADRYGFVIQDELGWSQEQPKRFDEWLQEQ